MKFGEKYELLESLTTGAVETFVANDKIRGQRVLVHILHCDPQKPNQPTVQWVLEAFRQVAPEPAGLVLEAGKYSGTLYAYLVTKLPDDPTLQGWVRQYKVQSPDTQEIPAPPAQPAVESAPPAEETKPKEPPQVPVGFTQIFRGIEPPGESNPPPQGKEVAPPFQSGPSGGSGGEQSGVHPAPAWDSISPRMPAGPLKETPQVTSPGSSFQFDFTGKNLRSETITPASKDGPKLGEFTSFFQGPFRAEAPSENPVAVPPISSQEMEPPRKVGEFTAIFGSMPPPGETTSPASGETTNDVPSSGFSGGWISDPQAPLRTTSVAEKLPPPPASVGLPRAANDNVSASPAPPKPPFVPSLPLVNVAPAPPISPIPPPPTPAVSKPPVPAPPAIPPAGAAPPFPPPVSVPAAGPPPVESTPSPYTRIISVRPPSPVDAEGAQVEAGAKPIAPSIPKIAVPPPPAPKPPKFAPPKAPKVPKVDAPKAPKLEAPKPPVSYWPLVLTLTVLFFIAVLLVLYFVLRH